MRNGLPDFLPPTARLVLRLHRPERTTARTTTRHVCSHRRKHTDSARGARLRRDENNNEAKAPKVPRETGESKGRVGTHVLKADGLSQNRRRRRLCDVRHTVNEEVVHDAGRRNAGGGGARPTSRRRLRKGGLRRTACDVSRVSLVRARAARAE